VHFYLSPPVQFRMSLDTGRIAKSAEGYRLVG
jgi:hypothetical protein